MSTKQELFTKVTGLTFNPDKITDPVKLAWLIPDGAMLDNTEGRRFEMTQEFMEAAGIDVEGKVAIIIESTASNENPKAKPAGKGWKKVVDSPAIEAVEGAAEYWIFDGNQYDADPTYETLSTFEVITDETSWNASFENGVLKLYYTVYSSEDLWNSTTNSAPTFNDRVYVGTISDDNAIYNFNVTWCAKSQKLTNAADSTEVYYMKRLDETSQYYNTPDEWKAQYATFDDQTWVLYTDEELTTEAGKEFTIRTTEFANCAPAYQGWIANGAKAPWIGINFAESDPAVKVIFKYEGKDDIYPWGENIFGNGEGHKSWGVAALPTEFNDNSATDATKLQVVLEHQGVEYVPAVEAVEAQEEQYHWERQVVNED